jgi:hypothetical protein
MHPNLRTVNQLATHPWDELFERTQGIYLQLKEISQEILS